MSPVEFKKRQYRPGEFRVKGPRRMIQSERDVLLHWSCCYGLLHRVAMICTFVLMLGQQKSLDLTSI